MSTSNWLLAVLCVGFLVVIWQLALVASHLSLVVASLRSLDSEVFHLAQEYNPRYGQCDSCGRRATVRNVVPKDSEPSKSSADTFYCQACWWMSDSVSMGDEARHYKDRPTEQDRLAAMVGPGAV